MKNGIVRPQMILIGASFVILPILFTNCTGYDSYQSNSQSQTSVGGENPSPTPSPGPTPNPGPAPIPSPQPNASTPPLTFDDARFTSAVSSSRVTLSDGGSFVDKSIREFSGDPTITCQGSCTLTRVRVQSGEAIRAVQGDMLIEDSYLEATGSGDDHADVIQTYSPGSHGTITLRNTSIVAHLTAATAGIFVADSWKPDLIDLENVVFNGGPFGLRLHADGYTGAHLRMKNVCFVGPFGYDRMIIDGFIIDQWENVNDCTIQNGQLTITAAIPKP